MEELQKLYAQKGQITTNIELSQAQLSQINKRLIELLNTKQSEVPKDDGKKDAAPAAGTK